MLQEINNNNNNFNDLDSNTVDLCIKYYMSSLGLGADMYVLSGSCPIKFPQGDQ